MYILLGLLLHVVCIFLFSFQARSKTERVFVDFFNSPTVLSVRNYFLTNNSIKRHILKQSLNTNSIIALVQLSSRLFFIVKPVTLMLIRGGREPC